MNKIQKLAERYPRGLPAVGLVFSGLASIGALTSDLRLGFVIALISAAGAVPNALSLLRDTRATRSS